VTSENSSAFNQAVLDANLDVEKVFKNISKPASLKVELSTSKNEPKKRGRKKKQQNASISDDDDIKLSTQPQKKRASDEGEIQEISYDDLPQQLADLRTVFNSFKDETKSLKFTVESLKTTVEILKLENKVLRESNQKLSSQVENVHLRFKLKEYPITGSAKIDNVTVQELKLPTSIQEPNRLDNVIISGLNVSFAADTDSSAKQ
jgi:hypothetical protein